MIHPIESYPLKRTSSTDKYGKRPWLIGLKSHAVTPSLSLTPLAKTTSARRRAQKQNMRSDFLNAKAIRVVMRKGGILGVETEIADIIPVSKGETYSLLKCQTLHFNH